MATLVIEHIKSDDRGRPYIAGTRIHVHDVALWHEGGWSVEKMVEQFDLTPGQAHAALSYYYDHKEEIWSLVEQEEDHAADFLATGQAILSSELRKQIEARRDGS